MEDVHVDMLDDVDVSKLTFETEKLIEYEISDNLSLMYDVMKKRFYIFGIDYEDEFEEYEVDIEEPFDGMELDGVAITKEDFDEFKSLVKNA